MILRHDFEPIRATYLKIETLSDSDVVFVELICEEIHINTLKSMNSSNTIDAAMFKSLDHNALNAKSMAILHHI